MNLQEASSSPPQLDGALMDMFAAEIVPTLRASATVAMRRRAALEREMLDAGLIPPPQPVLPPKKDIATAASSARNSVVSLASASGSKSRLGEEGEHDEESEGVRGRLESIGMHAGANLAERLSRDRGAFTDTLDAIKFICKDLWAACWEKQVDNLRTNHRGVYVLTDNQFKPLAHVSSFEGRVDAVRRAKIYAALPAGVIKGALARLGYNATVTPEINSLPQCTFQIKLPKSA